MRRLIAGTGWKMNNGAAAARRYADELKPLLAGIEHGPVDLYVLPPFTSLPAAAEAFAGSPVAIGGQNMHWQDSGNWTGEISAPMLVEAGCRYVELAHAERLQHFGETYAQVNLKVRAARRAGLAPIVCLGESADDKSAGRADAVLAEQLLTALKDVPAEGVPEIILAYEPRWAIGVAESATPDYITARHAVLRGLLGEHFGAAVADQTRIIYGGSVTPENGGPIIALDDVDGLFVGRAAWQAAGFARIVALVAAAAANKNKIPAQVAGIRP